MAQSEVTDILLIIMRDLNMTSQICSASAVGNVLVQLCTIHHFFLPQARPHKSKLRCKKLGRQLSPEDVLGTPEGKVCAEWAVIYVELETGGHRTSADLYKLVSCLVDGQLCFSRSSGTCTDSAEASLSHTSEASHCSTTADS